MLELVKERRASEAPGSDVLSILTHAVDEDGRRLSDHQLIGQVSMLLLTLPFFLLGMQSFQVVFGIDVVWLLFLGALAALGFMQPDRSPYEWLALALLGLLQIAEGNLNWTSDKRKAAASVAVKFALCSSDLTLERPSRGFGIR